MHLDITIIEKDDSRFIGIRIHKAKAMEILEAMLHSETKRVIIIPHDNAMEEAIGKYVHETNEEFTQRLKKEYEQSQELRKGDNMGAGMSY